MDSPFLLNTPWPVWLILLAGAAACWLTWRGYRRRAGELKDRRRWGLTALRSAGWVLLILCLLQPIYRQYVREERASRVSVLVDLSESMSFRDRTHGPERLEQVREALGDGEDGGLLEKLERTFKVKVEGFAANARPLEDVSLPLADGARTDLAQALNDAFTRLKGPDAAGLVLISDGADTARGDLLRAAQQYRRAGIPIYAVGVGAPDVPDLAVTQVRCRRTVSKDTLVKVEVDVARVKVPAGVYKVRVKQGSKTIKETEVDLAGEKATAIFEFLPTEQGFQEYEASIDPYAGELVLSNNAMAFGVVAFNRRLKVLYMEGSQHTHREYGRYVWADKWEHEFLVDALEEDRDVDVDVLFREMPPDYDGPIKTVKMGYPKLKKDLFQYDVVINSDIPIDHFNDDQIKWTVEFVANHGGGFIMIGGWSAFGEGGYAGSAFDKMLPVEMNKHDVHVDGEPFRWLVTETGLKHPIMQVLKDAKENTEAWAQLNLLGRTRGGDPGPSFFGFSKTTRAKPAADTLAVVADEEFETYIGPAVLVAVQPFGRGRSMAFTTDCTGGWGAIWEDSWGPDPDDPDRRNLYYKNFWKNAIRWLAHYRMKAPNQLVQLETERLVYGRGESPVVRVKVLTEDYEATHDALVTLQIVSPSGKSQRVSVFPRYEEPGVYERKLEPDEVGRYELEAFAEIKGKDLGQDKALLQVRPSTEELRQLSQDVATLQKLARESGGEYFTLDHAAGVTDLLRQDTHVIQLPRDKDLWDNGWVFAAIISLLCVEWFYRKRSGLP
ncbi:MAG: glutamine amidotransferase [Planctomycetota bacterium]|nr:glutamine amidotransferase [Planctomycetota bacterium]